MYLDKNYLPNTAI
uniref:Uncharacterized protein n=1 Tax=Rhizophora mucronata TaxID=61149 RepID=A0A2P2NXE9_RHIMU